MASLALAICPVASFAQTPERVVSMNLCTDQLAMLVAAPGQLLSVTYLAADPRASSMSAEAGELYINHGLAEEIAFLRPDLVIAGQYTTRVTVDMLRRLGYRVEVFPSENGLSDVRDNLRRMGQILVQSDRAEVLISEMDARLNGVAQAHLPNAPETALYYSSGYTSGEGSLADDILRHAGLKNVAPGLGLPSGGILPLEALVLAGPQIVIKGQSYQGYSRGQEMLNHPVLNAMLAPPRIALETSAAWSCGTPHTVAMIEELTRAARQGEVF